MEEPVLGSVTGALVSDLESRLVNAWPSFEVQLCDGWLLRFARGYSGWANSASPILPGATLDDALIDHIAAQFARQNLRPRFRLTSLEAPSAAERLAARGLVEVDPSLCLVAEIGGEAEVDSEVTLSCAPTARWLKGAAAAYGGDNADHVTLGEIVSRIRPTAAFATLDLDGKDVAWGLAVAERGYVGLFDIVVAPELRGLGLGRRIMSSLTAWGRGEGATGAYLQVGAANEVALALYRSMGFSVAYPYVYRVTP